MSQKVIKGYSRLIAFVLSVLGIGSTAVFTGCENGGGGGYCEYGTPSADFKISGVVTNSENKSAKGVKVVMQDTESSYLKDSTFSDESGNYEVTLEGFPDSQSFSVLFVDVDSSENGLLQDIDTTITFDNPEFENGDGGWYSGETSKTVNVSMKENGE